MSKSLETIEPLATAIGHMTIAWNHCQSYVFLIFDKALNADILRAKAIFFALRNDGAQREVTLAVLKEALLPDAYEVAKKTLSDFGKIAGRRNDLIHAMWHFPPDSDKATVFLNVKKSLDGKDPIEAANSLTRDLGVMAGRLNGLHTVVEAVMAPPPGLLAEPLPPQAVQTASSTPVPPTDVPEAPQTPPRSSQE